VTGQCGRLKCCLVYEHSLYQEMKKGLPKVGKRVRTPAGEGRVVELDVLRRMGERDYAEFTVQDKNKPQKIGNLTVELRSADAKKNKYTVALTVDDVRTEKKDRTVNEPVIFYPRGSRQADEFVVNSVGKNKISGYVSMPKNPPATSANASGS